MPRTMLQLRIEALAQHLSQAATTSDWKLLHLPEVNVDEPLWNTVMEKIYLEAHNLRTALGRLDERLTQGLTDERDGWRQFRQIQRGSEEVFQECLDLLGGLALRDRIQDDGICRVADEYIDELARATGRMKSFTIPGLDTRLSSTLRRVAKMQFPEWTVWTLPLVAHEYGHVVFEGQGLSAFAADLTAKQVVGDVEQRGGLLADIERSGNLNWFKGDFGSYMRKLVESADAGDVQAGVIVDQLKEVYARNNQRMRVLCADALATMLAGPAYAYAALTLRLNPIDDADRYVSDRDRAAAILAMLRAMNAAPPGQPAPHGDIVDGLTTYWRDSVEAAGGPSLDDDEVPAVDPDELKAEFLKYPGAESATYEGHHSLQAQRWCDDWIREQQAGMELSIPRLGPQEHLREALNALWRARVQLTSGLDPAQSGEAKHQVDLLARAGLSLCKQIIAQKTSERERRDPGGGVDPGRAQRPAG